MTESLLERDFCYHLEWDDDVVAYESQPEPIRYFYMGTYHTYTADFLVDFVDESQKLYEVKDTRFLDDEIEEELNVIGEYAKGGIVRNRLMRQEVAKKRFTTLKKCKYAESKNLKGVRISKQKFWVGLDYTPANVEPLPAWKKNFETVGSPMPVYWLQTIKDRWMLIL